MKRTRTETIVCLTLIACGAAYFVFARDFTLVELVVGEVVGVGVAILALPRKRNPEADEAS